MLYGSKLRAGEGLRQYRHGGIDYVELDDDAVPAGVGVAAWQNSEFLNFWDVSSGGSTNALPVFLLPFAAANPLAPVPGTGNVVTFNLYVQIIVIAGAPVDFYAALQRADGPNGPYSWTFPSLPANAPCLLGKSLTELNAVIPYQGFVPGNAYAGLAAIGLWFTDAGEPNINNLTNTSVKAQVYVNGYSVLSF